MIWPLLFGFITVRLVLAFFDGLTPLRTLPPNVVPIEGARVRRAAHRRAHRPL